MVMDAASTLWQRDVGCIILFAAAILVPIVVFGLVGCQSYLNQQAAIVD